MIKNIIIFSSGILIGYYIGYKVCLFKSQKIADEQVESTKKSLKEYYKNKLSEKDEAIDQLKEIVDKTDFGLDPSIDDAVNNDPIISNSKQYVDDYIKEANKYYNPIKNSDKEEVMKRPKNLPPTAINTPDGYPDPTDKNVEPYLIRDEDYGSLDDFDTLELILWNCNTVTTDDSAYDIISPTFLFKLLPENWVNMFGWGDENKYKDSLYFRNNELMKDIQIIKNNMTFKEWLEDIQPGRLYELNED